MKKKYLNINQMENNLMKYNIDELKHIYNKTDNDFKKFFIKKVIDYKMHILKNNKLFNNNINNVAAPDVLDDLINLSNDENNSLSNKSDDKPDEQIEDKYLKQIKFDSTNFP